MISSFPKIFNVGTDYIRDLFKEPVEVSEKVDGSQFAFGLHPEEGLVMRSKGRRIFPEELSSNDMFMLAVDYVQGLSLDEGVYYYCEYLQKPKHNVLTYDRTPENHLALYGVMYSDGGFEPNHRILQRHAGLIQITPVLKLGGILFEG